MRVLDRIIFYNDPGYELTGNVVHQLEKFADMDPKEIFKYIKKKKNWDGYSLSVANKALDMIISGDAKFVWKEVAEPVAVVEEESEEEKAFLKKLKIKERGKEKKEFFTGNPEPEDIPLDVEDKLTEEQVLEQEAARELEKMEREADAKPYVPNDLVKKVKEEVKKKAGRPKKK